MTRVIVGPLAILLLAAGRASAQAPGPPLDGPSLLPPGAKPAEVEPASPPRRPLLVIPGVTAPSNVASRFNLNRPTAPAAAPASEPPTAPGLSRPAPMVESIPLTLEPIPPGGDADVPARSRSTPPPDRAKPGETTGVPAPTAPSGSRYAPGSMLGRILGTGEDSAAQSAIRIESGSDPAVDAAVKRKVEQRIQEALGDRVKSAEVRVTGRTISIRAQASRFWHRRSVRRGLETLSLPAGYRGRVESVE